MKSILSISLLALTLLVYGQERELYLLKQYRLKPGNQLSVTEQYLSEAYLPALRQLGYSDIGVFKQIEPATDTTTNLFVLIPLKGIEDVASLEPKIWQQDVHKMKGGEYINASHESPPYLRIETSVMVAFEKLPRHVLPKLTGERSRRVYELRSYEGPTEMLYKSKVEMFNAGGEIDLFDKLDFNAVFYAEVLAGANMPNLVYMTTFDDMESRDAHWKEFFGSPEWKELLTVEKYKNTVSGADIYLLQPTDYSDY